MSLHVQILLEGTRTSADRQFVEAVIAQCFPGHPAVLSYIHCEGWHQLNKHKQPIQNHQDLGNAISLILFDADGEPETRRQEILGMLRGMGIGFECPVFLFPDNQSAGTLEALLRQLGAVPGFFECWDQFQACLHGLSQTYRTDAHQMVYAYEQVYLTQEELKKLKKGGRFQGNAARLWRIADDAQPLRPLLDFLRPHLG
jgi:hypothetical protein